MTPSMPLAAPAWTFVDSVVSQMLHISSIGFLPKADWAGRAILQRWLGAGGDWNIYAVGGQNRDWKDYMMGAETLQQQVYRELVQEVWPHVNAKGIGTYFFERNFAGDTGVSSSTVSGYGYLHGTDRTVGGFQMSGCYWVQQAANGGYVVAARLTFTWNDKINPNGKQDWGGVVIGNIESLGRATDYRIAITWDSMTAIHFDAGGSAIDSRGWPGADDPIGRPDPGFPAYHFPPDWQR